MGRHDSMNQVSELTPSESSVPYRNNIALVQFTALINYMMKSSSVVVNVCVVNQTATACDCVVGN